jgi:hypothetical protein
MNIKERKT